MGKRSAMIVLVLVLVGGIAIAAHMLDWPGMLQAINPHG